MRASLGRRRIGLYFDYEMSLAVVTSVSDACLICAIVLPPALKANGASRRLHKAPLYRLPRPVRCILFFYPLRIFSATRISNDKSAYVYECSLTRCGGHLVRNGTRS